MVRCAGCDKVDFNDLVTCTLQQLTSVAQLVRVLHRNRRVVDSVPSRGPCATFYAVVPGEVLKCIYTHLDYKP